jgi:Zn-dependent M28 family amino/carboxypeptidase
VRSRFSTDTSHALAIRYILLRLRSFGLTPVEQSFGTGGKNIIAIQIGTTEPDRFVMIGAHYESMPKDTISPGADDNASGVAATLEAARVFSKVQPSRSVIYALWDREEQGLLGSKAYADQAKAAGMLIDGVVNVDMIGYDGDSDMKVEVHVNGTALSNVVADSMAHANVICATPLSIVVINPGTTASDHASFWRNSYGALLLIEEYFGHDFNPFYHSRNDRVTAMSQAYFTYAARLAAGTVARLAGPIVVPAGLPRR